MSEESVPEINVEEVIAQLSLIAQSVGADGSVGFLERPAAPSTSTSKSTIDWNAQLGWLTAYPGNSIVLLRYPPDDAGKSKARTQARAIRSSLEDKSPNELWVVDAQFTTDTWSVFVSFERERTTAEQEALAQSKLESKQRAQHAQDIAKADKEGAAAMGIDVAEYRVMRKAGTLPQVAAAAPAKGTRKAPVPAAPAPAATGRRR